MEVTPLAHAASKGFKGMVELLINSGANVNYLCSVKEQAQKAYHAFITNGFVSLPPLAFSIIGNQNDIFHLLLECDNLDKSLIGVRPYTRYKEIYSVFLICSYLPQSLLL